MQVELSSKNDRSEKVYYRIPDFPVYVQRGQLSSYPNFSAISHWHDDLEFILVLEGHMTYNVNGTTVKLQKGEGIFVNTRQLHYGFSKDLEECIFLCLLFHPMLLCSSPYIEKKYVLPVIEQIAMPYLLLHPDRKEEKEILQLLDKINHCQQKPFEALKLQSLFFEIWEHLYLLSDHVEQPSLPKSQHLTILKDMIRFIYEHYTEKLSLSQISLAGNVGKTTCCTIFQKYTNCTPITYLNHYRLKKSIELLKTTDKTISEICFEVGFSSASYFTETFQNVYRCTPKAFRKKIKV